MAVHEHLSRTGIISPSVVLIMPAFNEATRLNGNPYKRALEDNMTAFSDEFTHSRDYRMLVVDDGSKDNTGELAQEFGYELVTQPNNFGKGAAIRSGVRFVLNSLEGSDIDNLSMAFTDADGSYSAYTMLDLVGLTKGEADIAIAKRVQEERNRRSWRDYAYPAVQHMFGLIAPTGVSDPQAGAMAFSGSAIDLWSNSLTNGYAAPAEVLYLAKKLGLKAAELPAQVNTVGESRVKPSDGIRILWDAARIRLNNP
jgi:glycosyltransferase involved in cell wall biosynthesis